MRQDLTVAEDGSATLAIEISVDAAMLALANQSNPSNDFCNSSTFPEAEGVSTSMTKSTERGDFICTVAMTGTVDALGSMWASAAEKAAQAPGAVGQMTMALFEEGDYHRFEMTWPLSTMAPEKPASGGIDTSGMMTAMFAGRSISMGVTAPKIIETSGDLSADGRSASYSFPLAMAIQRGQPDLKFYAVFAAGRAKLFGIF
ncbi:hypothetical protein [Devosia sp. SD17-2]|uniref:hypothetical protein n=1 Tax=Devosia sp. SD17-2 TaxID=2976459 RepID=UPI0023D89B72|nr:hypothetical protein [Devosia sp. SD17-2]WEJ31984.1 hypothetical protein NYQ88_13855 [Devosia sp. SD17-2]